MKTLKEILLNQLELMKYNCDNMFLEKYITKQCIKLVETKGEDEAIRMLKIARDQNFKVLYFSELLTAYAEANKTNN